MKLKELLAKMEDNLKKYSVVTDNTFQQHEYKTKKKKKSRRIHVQRE